MGQDSGRESAENKLILLYLLESINMPVSNLQVTKIILENSFMNYFLLQQFLNELCDAGLVHADSSGDKTLYTITQSGKQTLGYFPGLIPPGIKARIDNSIASIRKNIKNETLITADYIPESENKYTADCSMNEDNFSLIELKISVGSKNDARTICENWKKHPQAIYAEIIEILTKKR